jgi:hypothetical protein
MWNGNSVSEVLIRVSTVCWSKIPQNTAKTEQRIKVGVDMLKKLLEASKLSGTSINSVANVKAGEEANGKSDQMGNGHNYITACFCLGLGKFWACKSVRM